MANERALVALPILCQLQPVVQFQSFHSTQTHTHTISIRTKISATISVEKLFKRSAHTLGHNFRVCTLNHNRMYLYIFNDEILGWELIVVALFFFLFFRCLFFDQPATYALSFLLQNFRRTSYVQYYYY